LANSTKNGKYFFTEGSQRQGQVLFAFVTVDGEVEEGRRGGAPFADDALHAGRDGPVEGFQVQRRVQNLLQQHHKTSNVKCEPSKWFVSGT